MSRIKKIVRNFIILVILFFLSLNRTGLYLSPLSVHEHSERSIHYGPSEVIHMEDFEKGKYILCKYDKWISCNTVKKILFFFWTFGNQPTGFENNKSKAVDYTGGGADQHCKIYGIINDHKIKKIELTLDNNEIHTQTEFYDDLFLFTWNTNNNKGWRFKSIKGYDSENNIIFVDNY
jgi:hypothetical protein